VIASVALRNRARPRLRRPGGTNAIVRRAPEHDDRRDSDVAVALVGSGEVATIALEECDRRAAGLVPQKRAVGLARIEQAPAPRCAEERGSRSDHSPDGRRRRRRLRNWRRASPALVAEPALRWCRRGSAARCPRSAMWEHPTCGAGRPGRLIGSAYARWRAVVDPPTAPRSDIRPFVPNDPFMRLRDGGWLSST
jgi:hypothetical protein